MTLKAITAEVRKLTRDEQYQLLNELFQIVDADAPLSTKQHDDLRQRIADFRAGKEAMIPGDEVVARMRARA